MAPVNRYWTRIFIEQQRLSNMTETNRIEFK